MEQDSPRLCTVCEAAPEWVHVEDGDYGYCLSCWYSGRYFEKVLASDERANLLDRIRQINNVVAADVFHFGGGAFNFGITLRDGRFVTPGTPSEILGQALVVPAIPQKGDPWAVMVARPGGEESEGWSGKPTVMPDLVDDEGLVKLIEEIA